MAGGAMLGEEAGITNRIHRWDSATNALTEVIALPDLWIDGAATWNERTRELVMYGGANGSVYHNFIRAYSPERGIVRMAGALPHNTDNACAVRVPERNSTFVIGGHANGISYDDIIEVLPSGATRLVGTLPQPVDMAACVLHNGVIYIMGGENHVAHVYLDTIYAFAPATGTVSLVGTLQRKQLVRAYTHDNNGRVWLLTGGTSVQYVEIK